jgi:glycosyltransferase involved in cell wall biosynthesis
MKHTVVAPEISPSPPTPPPAPPSRPLRIGIDVRYLSHGIVGGVQAYVAQFVPEVIALAPEHQFILYADTKRPLELGETPANVAVRRLRWASPLSSLRHDLGLARHARRDRLDVIHFPANYGFGGRTPTVITLHDAINILPLLEIWRGHPKRPRMLAMMTYLHFASVAAVRRANLVITDSESAKTAILQHATLEPDRIVSIPLAPTPDLHRVSDPARLADLRARMTLPSAFVLADALKNPAVLVHAWRRLPAELRSGRRIVFFSRRPDPPGIVAEAVASGEARLLIRPSRADLLGLYSLADAFVFPSWYEGFGLPLLEAMTCGAPVIASNRGSIPEVVALAALLADAEDVDTFTRHLAAVLGDPGRAAALRAAGFARAAEFSWRKTAQAILACYALVGAGTRQREGRT